MQDIDITAELVRSSFFGETDMLGGCTPDLRNGEAQMYILDSLDHVNDSNMEETLVHELLHVLVAPLVRSMPKDADDDAEEALVSKLAKVLVRAYGK